MIAQLIIGPKVHDGRSGGKQDKGWETEGWVRWLEGLRGNYERRMQSMCKILDAGSQLVKTSRPCDEAEWEFINTTSMYTFQWPMGGMFVWVKMNLEMHPLFDRIEHDKLAHALWVHLTTPEYLVLVAPGTIFAPTEKIRKESSWKFFRICFAAVDEGDIERTSTGFVEGVKSFWGKKELDEIAELAKEKAMDEFVWM